MWRKIFCIAITLSLISMLIACGGNAPSDVGKDEDLNQTGVKVGNSVISWANMKVDNPNLDLTDEQKNILLYFDNDYLYVSSYETLQKYPKAYRNAQIEIDGIVVKVLNADDDNYECLFRADSYDNPAYSWDDNGNAVFEPPKSTGDKLVIIKGKQSDERIAEGDAFYCYGRYIDVNKVDVDGVSLQLPLINVNSTQKLRWLEEGDYDAVVEDRFSVTFVEEVGKAIFGNDIKISEPHADLGDGLHLNGDMFYVITPDNQTNSNFTSFEIYTGRSYIMDSRSTISEFRTFDVAADFEHYIISVFYRDSSKMYLEYYDKDFKKLWGREFNGVSDIPFDYTADRIYLAADNDFYIIDTKTGEDIIEPTIVGQKVKVNAIGDGVILIGKGEKDNVMKVDNETGQILWKTSIDLNVTDCSVLQIVDGSIIVSLVNITFDDEDGDGFQQTWERTTSWKTITVSVDNNAGEIGLSFIADEYEYE
jgi:outer membrane protein assembly factor BamB